MWLNRDIINWCNVLHHGKWNIDKKLKSISRKMDEDIWYYFHHTWIGMNERELINHLN